jgi:IMP dehydrogenase
MPIALSLSLQYHGMTSVTATLQRSHAMDSFASGVSGSVVDKGSVHRFIPYLNQSVKHGLQDMGVKSVATLHQSLYGGSLRFEMKSPAAQKEGKVHDLHSFTTKLFKSTS